MAKQRGEPIPEESNPGGDGGGDLLGGKDEDVIF